MEDREEGAKVGAGGTAKSRQELLSTGDRLEASCGGELVANLKSYDAAIARAEQAQAEADALKKEIERINEKIERIRRYRKKLLAMTDEEFEDSQRTFEWAFEPLLKKSKQSKEVVCLGSNMHPTIKEGELTHVDTGVNSFSGNGIYCLEVGQFSLIRRLIEDDDGTLRIVSDNPNKIGYPDQLVPVDERWKINIAGKVVRWLRVCSEKGAQ